MLDSIQFVRGSAGFHLLHGLRLDIIKQLIVPKCL